MQTRTLGTTGLTVSPLGLGLAALGRPEYMTLSRDADFGADRSVAAMEGRCHAMLDAAYAAGVRYVDAARSYGRAEAFLASWLRRRQLPRDGITVGSKWGYTYTAGWQLGAAVHEVKNLSAATLERQIGESRELLGADLRVYQIHSATLESGVLEDARVLARLAALGADGVAIGLTVTGARQGDVIRRALDASVDGVNPFQIVQATWNLLEVSAGPALAEAKAAGWGVIVKESLANGRLTDRDAPVEAAPLAREARARNLSVEALAIAAAVAQPWADVVLTGAVTPAQLASNVAALALAPQVVDLPPIALEPRAYWERRSALSWG